VRFPDLLDGDFSAAAFNHANLADLFRLMNRLFHLMAVFLIQHGLFLGQFF
jgi:hypothetical protein